jgi:hypothetical protein
VDNELERLRKVATMAPFEVLSQYLPSGTEEIYKGPIRIVGVPVDLNLSPPKHKSEPSPFRPAYSVYM